MTVKCPKKSPNMGQQFCVDSPRRVCVDALKFFMLFPIMKLHVISYFIVSDYLKWDTIHVALSGVDTK